MDATGVFLIETVPTNSTTGANPGWEVVPPGSGVPCDGIAPGISCAFSVGTLASGASGTASFVTIADDPIPILVHFMDNTAAIGHDGANGLDPDTSNNFANFAVALFEPPLPPVPLATLQVPAPNLSNFLNDGTGAGWGVVLGKALF